MNWVTFVGEGRSGHTILSGILGSHPNALISEEQKYISKWRRGWDKERILSRVLVQGPGQTRKRQGWTNLATYTDPLSLVGDKCGWDAVNEYAKRGAPSSLINDYAAFIELPVKTIVTVRNPLDNIASWLRGNKARRMYLDRADRGEKLIRRYRRFYKNAVDILEQVDDYKVVQHERLVDSPSEVIQELADWLGLPHNRPWRRQSAKRIWSEPRERRHEVTYSETELDEIRRIINTIPLLEYYR